MTAAPAAALCQCTKCVRYLARNRDPESEFRNQHQCEECYPGIPDMMNEAGAYAPGLPLADIRGPESLSPLDIELLGWMTEECGEVGQRIGKIQRWGWKADFEGTTQQHKLETELGDVIATMVVAAHNGKIDLDGVIKACEAKLAKLDEDAAGPRQRLRHLLIPQDGFVAFAVPMKHEDPTSVIYRVIKRLLDVFVADTRAERERCECNDRPHAGFCPARAL